MYSEEEKEKELFCCRLNVDLKGAWKAGAELFFFSPQRRKCLAFASWSVRLLIRWARKGILRFRSVLPGCFGARDDGDFFSTPATTD